MHGNINDFTGCIANANKRYEIDLCHIQKYVGWEGCVIQIANCGYFGKKYPMETPLRVTGLLDEFNVCTVYGIKQIYCFASIDLEFNKLGHKICDFW